MSGRKKKAGSKKGGGKAKSPRTSSQSTRLVQKKAIASPRSVVSVSASVVTPRDAMIEFDMPTSRGEKKQVTRVLTEEEKEELRMYGSAGPSTSRQKSLAWVATKGGIGDLEELLLPKLSQMDSEGRSLEERTETINKVFYDAATHEHIANVKTMLAKVRGVDVNMTWGPRKEPIVMLCRRMNGRLDLVELLVRNGADIYKKNIDGENLLAVKTITYGRVDTEKENARLIQIAQERDGLSPGKSSSS